MKHKKLASNVLLKSFNVPDKPRESLDEFLARGGQIQRVEPARAIGALSQTTESFSVAHGDGNRWVGHKTGA